MFDDELHMLMLKKLRFSMVQLAEASGWLPHAPVQPSSLQFARGCGSHGALQNGLMPPWFLRFFWVGDLWKMGDIVTEYKYEPFIAGNL